MAANPYDAPTTTIQSDSVRPVRLMSWSTVGFILAVGLVGAVIGGCSGWIVGVFAPQYYQTIFNSAGRPGFNPISFGLSIGAMQGFATGMVLGTLLSVLQAWFEDRRFNRQYH